jgi:hypothetical protein
MLTVGTLPANPLQLQWHRKINASHKNRRERMKRTIKAALAAAALLLTAGSAWALPSNLGDYDATMSTNYERDNSNVIDGEYKGYYAATINNVTYGSFCLEKGEYFTPGSSYDIYNVSNTAYNGGPDDDQSNGLGDPISNATKWLYYHFLLKDFNTTLGLTYNDYAMQLAIWYLEDEIQTLGTSTVDKLAINYVDKAGSMTVTDPYADIQVINLGSWCSPKQSQLIGELQPVPEPSTLLLLGGGIAGLALARRRASKK